MLKLLIRPNPKTDENFFSYAIRVAMENLCSVYDIYSLLDLTYRNSHPNVLFQADIEKGEMMRRLGKKIVTSNSFLSQTNTKSSRIYSITIQSQLLPNYLFNKKVVKICPYCIIDKKYLINNWQLVHNTTCHLHKCLLWDRCPECNKPLKWHSDLLQRCNNCNLKWKDMVPSYQTIALKENELILSKTLYNSLNNNSMVNFPPFSDLSYFELTTTISLTAWVMPEIRAFWNMNYIEQSNNKQTHDLLCTVLNVFLDWPRNFFKFLDSIKSSHKYRISSAYSSNKYLGSFAEFYQKLYKQESLKEIKFEFERYIMQHSWPSDYKVTFPRATFDDTKEQLYSINELNNMFGLALPTNISSIELIEYLPGQFLLLREKKRSLFSIKYRSDLFTQECLELLGVTEDVVSELVNLNIITARKDASSVWHFAPISIKNLINTFEKRLEKQIVSFPKELHYLRMAASPLGSGFTPNMAAIIKKVISGTLKPCHKDSNKNGLNKYAFCKHAIKNAFREEITDFNSGCLSIKDVSKKMKLSRNSVHYFMREGYIINNLNSKGVKVISRQSIDEFNERYMISTEIAKVVGVGSPHIVKWLSVRGIFPINPTKNHYDHQYLYARTQEILHLLETHKIV